MSKRILAIIGGCLILVTILFYSVSNLFAPGSYPYAEIYDVNRNESELIKAIKKFKSDNPQYNVPDLVQMPDGRRDSSDHWYHIYFYFPEENQLIKTWTRPADEINKTTFAFVGVHDGVGLGGWKFINKDLGWLENRREKEKFETRILEKIKVYLKKQ